MNLNMRASVMIGSKWSLLTRLHLKSNNDTQIIRVGIFSYFRAQGCLQTRTWKRLVKSLFPSELNDIAIFRTNFDTNYSVVCLRQGSMVIEYIGSIIRNEVANRREQIYEKQVRFFIIMCRTAFDVIVLHVASSPKCF